MPLAPDDLVAMVLFARVVEAQSFTAAAAVTGLSKSAVSERVSRLERSMGTRLLHRTTRRMTLTEAGVDFYQRCARIAAEADEAARTVQGKARGMEGTVRMSVPVMLGATHVAPALARLLERLPQLVVEMTADDRFVDVVHGGFDVVLRMSSARRMKESSVIARRLASDRYVVCAAPSYLARHGRPESPGDLLRHRCLRYSYSTLHEEWRHEGPGGGSVPVTGPFAANSGLVLRSAVAAGAGVAILPSFMVADLLASGAVEALLREVRWPALGVYALASSREQPARVRAVVDHLAAELKGGLGPGAGVG